MDGGFIRPYPLTKLNQIWAKSHAVLGENVASLDKWGLGGGDRWESVLLWEFIWRERQIFRQMLRRVASPFWSLGLVVFTCAGNVLGLEVGGSGNRDLEWALVLSVLALRDLEWVEAI